jgi:hypothetical protein
MSAPQVPDGAHALGPTCLRHGHHVRDIGHEDAALKLQLRILVSCLGRDRARLILLILALAGHHLLATQQDALEQVNFVLLRKKRLLAHAKTA